MLTQQDFLKLETGDRCGSFYRGKTWNVTSVDGEGLACKVTLQAGDEIIVCLWSPEFERLVDESNVPYGEKDGDVNHEGFAVHREDVYILAEKWRAAGKLSDDDVGRLCKAAHVSSSRAMDIYSSH